MHIFGYGSLMKLDSFKESSPEAIILGKVVLPGYKRIFNLKGSYRKNKKGEYISVLNIVKDDAHAIAGVNIDIPETELPSIFKREGAYNLHEITLEDGTNAHTFIGKEDRVPHPYLFNDETQKDYLRICVDAARDFGIIDNFLDTTFIEDKTIRELNLIS